MKILFLAPKCTNVEPILGSLEREGHDIDPFYFTEHHGFGWELARTFSDTSDYEVVVYVGIAGGKDMPPTKDLAYITKNSKSVMICCDGSCPDWHPILLDYLQLGIFDKIINIDGNRNVPAGIETTLCPIDPRPYKPLPMNDRPFLVGFCGGLGSPERLSLVSELRGLLHVRDRDDDTGTYENYVSYLCKCRMVLNMPASGPGNSFQVKARVIEAALARTVLLEQSNPITRQWFIPNIEYYEYDNVDSIRKIVMFMEQSPNVLEHIANNMIRKLRAAYSAGRFWTDAFDFHEKFQPASLQNPSHGLDAGVEASTSRPPL